MGGLLPHRTDRLEPGDRATVTQMLVHHAIPAQGTVVPVTIPSDASHFTHRQELVYLLPAGNAIKTIDDFAAAHRGNAPVFVLVDSGGAFNNDTECVNGPRGNSADHLTKHGTHRGVSGWFASREVHRPNAHPRIPATRRAPRRR